MLDELLRFFAAVPPDQRHSISVLVPGRQPRAGEGTGIHVT